MECNTTRKRLKEECKNFYFYFYVDNLQSGSIVQIYLHANQHTQGKNNIKTG